MNDKYTVVERGNLEDLVVEVNALIQEGYHPVGIVNKVARSYLQAMYLHPSCADKCTIVRNIKYHSTIMEESIYG